MRIIKYKCEICKGTDKCLGIRTYKNEEFDKFIEIGIAELYDKHICTKCFHTKLLPKLVKIRRSDILIYKLKEEIL